MQPKGDAMAQIGFSEQRGGWASDGFMSAALIFSPAYPPLTPTFTTTCRAAR